MTAKKFGASLKKLAHLSGCGFHSSPLTDDVAREDKRREGCCCATRAEMECEMTQMESHKFNCPKCDTSGRPCPEDIENLIGNAVPPFFAFNIAKCVLEYLQTGEAKTTIEPGVKKAVQKEFLE